MMLVSMVTSKWQRDLNPGLWPQSTFSEPHSLSHRRSEGEGPLRTFESRHPFNRWENRGRERSGGHLGHTVS